MARPAAHKGEYDGYACAGHDGDAAAPQVEWPALEVAPEQDAQQDGRGICTRMSGFCQSLARALAKAGLVDFWYHT